jgi:hypothetical protein
MSNRRRAADEGEKTSNTTNGVVVVDVTERSDDDSSSSFDIGGSGPGGAGGTPFLASTRNRRMIFVIVLLATAFYLINQREQMVLDESHYEDARKNAIRKQGHHNRYTSIDTYKRPKGPTGQFVLQPESEFTPQIAWLMSFPNSGTSFTMTMVARASNTSFATNYGDEVTSPDQADSLSIYPRRPEGPYWAGMSGKIASPRELPDKYVITKTHWYVIVCGRQKDSGDSASFTCLHVVYWYCVQCTSANCIHTSDL